MSFGKAKAPPAPDYTPIAQADAKAAAQQMQLGEEQLQFGKQQFEDVWPYAQQYLQTNINAANNEVNNAQNQQAFYQNTYQPIESNFATTAQNYNTPGNAEQKAGEAMADVSNQFNASRNAALANLESFGIDPSQTRFGALDLSTRISQAAATAAAGTQSRLNTEATGLALEGEAINIGRGYPGSVAQAYNTATNSGSSALGSANNTNLTGSSMMGTPTQYMGLGNQSRFGQAQALNYGFNNSLAGAQFNAQMQANQMTGIGQLVGGGVSAAALFL